MATWKKLVVSGSSIEQLANSAGYITSASLFNAYATASINGIELLASSPTSSFSIVTGSSGTGLTISGSAGNDIITFDLSSIPNTTLANSSIYISGSENGAIGTIGSVALGASGSIAVQYDDGTIGVNGSNQLEVKDNSLTVAKLAAAAVVTSAEGISDTTSGSDDSVATTKAIVDFVDSQIGSANDLTVGADSGLEAIDLVNDIIRFVSGSDGTIGADLTKASNTGSVAFSLNTGSDHFSAGVRGKISVADTTGAAGINLSYDSSTGEISGSLVNSTISGKDLGTDLDNLTVDNATLALDSGTTYNGSAARTISIKDGGVDTDALADSLGTLGENEFTGSFSGSFVGDGQGLTGIATTLTVDGDTGTEDVNLVDDDLQIIGTSNEVDTAVTKVGNDVKVTVGLTQDVTIERDLTVTRDATISRNLTVLGTASFQHTEDLDVADRFIRLASGSNSAGDGGIVIQQTSNLDGEVFGFDAASGGAGRFGVSGSFDASQNAFTPDAFMAAVIEGSDENPNSGTFDTNRYDAKGNIFIQGDSDGTIWIYS